MRTLPVAPRGSISVKRPWSKVGFYNDDQGATTTRFLRSKNARFISINVPGSQATGPLKLNDRRQAVGIYVDGDAPPADPDGTPPAGVVHGFLWDDGDYTTIDVPGATATLVLGINNRGQMVGSYVDAEGAYHDSCATEMAVSPPFPRLPAPTR